MKIKTAILTAVAAAAVSAGAYPTAPKGTEWESEQELGFNKLPPRAWFGHFPDTESAKGILMQTSPWHRFLDSETDWRFKWTKCPKDRPADFYRADYDVSGWDVVKVPCSWQAPGIRPSGEFYGLPLFFNQGYLWAGTSKSPAPEGLWPKVTGVDGGEGWWLGPEDNPVGSYRRDFEVPAEWNGMDVYLQFDGVESFFYLWVNGEYVGFSKNSRSPAAFNITRYLRQSSNTSFKPSNLQTFKPSNNSLSLEVYRNSDGAYLESQDIYRLAGIFRHVRLYAVPRHSIADVKFDTEPVEPGVYDGDWKVKLVAEYRYTGEVRNFERDQNLGYTVAARLFDDRNREVALTGKTVGETLHQDNTPYWADNNFSLAKLEFSVAKPKTWNAETPNLYTLVVELKDEKGVLVESAGFQLGFREALIRRAADPKDHVFLHNGQPVKTMGVNRGECDLKYGHYVPDEEVLQDIELIKRANMNHVRCSHFPQGEYFYYLCNLHGIYLMDEANLESHGYFYGDLSLSHREEWRAAHIDRVRSMYEWDKNFPSVVLWSLGNEAGPGRNFKECYEYLKGRDAKRPVNWERNNSLVDIGSRQYPNTQWMRDVAAGTNTVMYPYHVNEYAHDRLSCPQNDLQGKQDAIDSSDRIIGAAIWDWADQGLLVKKNGRWLQGWPGEFGEKQIEAAGGDGILEGVVKGDRTPEPVYYEAKHAYQPYRITPDGEGFFRIRSRRYFTDSSDLDWQYAAVENGVTGEWKMLDFGAPIGPREIRRVAMPAAVVRIRARQKRAANLVPAGWTVVEEQLGEVRVAAPVAAKKDADWSFDPATGLPRGLDMTLEAFRYPVGEEIASYVGPGPNAIYRECLREGLRELKPTAVVVRKPVETAAGTEIVTEQLWRGLNREDATSVCHQRVKLAILGPTTATNTAIRAVNRWTIRKDGTLALKSEFRLEGRRLDEVPDNDWAPKPKWKTLPSLGWKFTAKGTGPVEYCGRGPWDNYEFRNASAFVQVWKAASAADLVFPYTRPQDAGNRTDVRYVKTAGLVVSAADAPFTARITPYAPEEILLADHPEDLPPPSRTFVSALSTDGHSLSLVISR